jgi:broad specificity phosphatase PhoE
MDRVAKKDQAEREDDEASRLVREAPKLKPSRHDKKRERMNSDADPDLKRDDKDTSMNYKTIGGSVVDRVAARYAKQERVPAKSKETGETVLVSPKTLQEESGKYEVIQKDDDQASEEPQEPQSDDSAEEPREKPPQKAEQGQEKAEKPKDPPSKDEGAETNEPEKPSVADETGISTPQRAPVSAADREETSLLLADNLPPKLAAKLIAEDIHPEDARNLVASYQAMAAKPVGDVQKFAEKTAAFFETNPDKVQPPKSWKNASGDTVPFDSLSSQEQADAYRQHQMQVVAASLAAEAQLRTKFAMPSSQGRPSVPEAVAAALADSILKGPKKAQDLESAQEKASEVFKAIASEGPYSKMTPGRARQLLGYVKGNEQAEKVARAFLEANDYKEAKGLYLRSGTLNEDMSASELADRLVKSRRFFAGKVKDYGSTDHGGGRYFEAKVLSRLREIDPGKYRKVHSALARQDAADYKRAVSAYEKALKKWRKEGQSGPEPEKPRAPSSLQAAKSTSDLRSEAKDLLGDLETRSKIATTVAGRHLISTYLSGRAMALNTHGDRAALYHGVDPQEHYPSGPYRGWGQAHQRDLSESDYAIILDSATDWLKQPILTLSVGGMVPDQKYRAALDYAIQTSPYNRAIDVPTYNKLLARLQEVPEPSFTQPGLPTLRARKEASIFRAFPRDARRKVGSDLHVMLTGKTAKALKLASHTVVDLGRMPDSHLNVLSQTLRVRTAAEAHTHAPEEAIFVFEGDGVVSSEVTKDLETLDYFFRDSDGDTHEDGYLQVVNQADNSLTIAFPEGSKAEALRAIEGVAKRHELVVRTASSSIAHVQGGTSSLNSRSSGAWATTHLSEDPQEYTPMKLSTDQTNEMLGRLDKVASDIKDNARDWGIPFKVAKAMVNALDKTADTLEVAAFGEDSLRNRQAEMAFEDRDLAKFAKEALGDEAFAKAAKVHQRDADEPYMDTFNNIMAPHETDADEPYMSAYSDNQSVAVLEGVSEDGDDLTPNY